uniref:Uncharacterized protein n=1 Tax=Alexandrium catenella TaxID=2925 RepID=A0A7S1MKF8_ALECA
MAHLFVALLLSFAAGAGAKDNLNLLQNAARMRGTNLAAAAEKQTRRAAAAAAPSENAATEAVESAPARPSAGKGYSGSPKAGASLESSESAARQSQAPKAGDSSKERQHQQRSAIAAKPPSAKANSFLEALYKAADTLAKEKRSTQPRRQLSTAQTSETVGSAGSPPALSRFLLEVIAASGKQGDALARQPARLAARVRMG